MTNQLQKLIKNFDKRENFNYWVKGHIDPWWTTEHRSLSYTREPFNNKNDIQRFTDMGFSHKYYTGEMYDMRNTTPEWFDLDRFKKYFNFHLLSWSFYKMTTGVILPVHVDTFKKFKEMHMDGVVGSGERNGFHIDGEVKQGTIVRSLVMLEDWQQGHYLDMDNYPIVNWKAGDYFIWEESVPHTAANIGELDRYTLQFTGVITESLVNYTTDGQ